MNSRTILVFAILAVNYVVVYYARLATGFNFYLVQILAYVVLILLTLSDAQEHLRINRLTSLIFYYTVTYISVYMFLGLFTGFGISPYSSSLPGLLLNVVFTISRYASLEFIRLHLASNLRYRNRALSFYVPAFTVWFLTWFPYPLLSISLDLKGFRTIFRYLVPSLVNNMFSTFLVLNGGFASSMIYNVLPQLVLRLPPYLPNLDWFIEGVFNTVVPLVGFYMVLPYTWLGKRNRRLVKMESKGFVDIAVYFVVAVFISMMFHGYLGIRLYVISSRSMEPVLRVGDVVVVCKICGEPREGDIVAYLSEYGVIVHRVVEVVNETGSLVTKGDANTNVDPRPVKLEYVLGKVVLTLPRIGYMAIYARKGVSEDLTPLFLVALVLIMSSRSLARCRR